MSGQHKVGQDTDELVVRSGRIGGIPMGTGDPAGCFFRDEQ